MEKVFNYGILEFRESNLAGQCVDEVLPGDQPMHVAAQEVEMTFTQWLTRRIRRI